MVERVKGISLYDFTGIAQEIAEIAGIEVATTLCEAYGGTQIHIPSAVDADHWLSLCVGNEAANKICEHFSSFGLNDDADLTNQKRGIRYALLPLGPASLRSKAHRKLVEYLKSGMPARRAARLAGVSERTAWNVKAHLRDLGEVPPRQAGRRSPHTDDEASK